MKQETINNRVILTAKKGYFLANKDMSIYGTKLSLGAKDKADNYKELPMSEYPQIEEIIDPLTPEEELQLENLLKRKEATNKN